MASERGLVIFNLDGTLFRADEATVPAARRAFEERGLPVPPEEQIRYFIGKPTPRFHEWLASVAPDGMGPEIAEAVDRHEIELVLRQGSLYAGVEQMLAAVRKQAARMAICTNGPKGYVEAVIESQRLARFFDAVRHLEHDGDNKVAMVADVLGRLPQRPAVVVGDRRDDVEAAHRNGLPCIAAVYGLGTREELAGADAVAEHPSDLPEVIRQWLREDD